MIPVITIFWAALFAMMLFLLSAFFKLVASVLSACIDTIITAVVLVLFGAVIYIGLNWISDIIYNIVIGEFANKLGEFLITILVIAFVIALLGGFGIAAASLLFTIIVWIAGTVTAVVQGIVFVVSIIAHWCDRACNFFLGIVLKKVAVC